MGYGEAWRLLMILLNDPSSQFAAAFGDWEFPITRADMAFRDWIDMNTARTAKPYSRPWVTEARNHGAGTSMTVDEFEAKRAAAASN